MERQLMFAGGSSFLEKVQRTDDTGSIVWNDFAARYLSASALITAKTRPQEAEVVAGDTAEMEIGLND